MVNATKNSFSATKVANNGLAIGEMALRLFEAEKEVKRLRHHVSVLSKRLRKMERGNGETIEKVVEEGNKEEVAEVAEVVDEVAEAEADGASPIASGAYMAEAEGVAEDGVASVEVMSVASEDEVVGEKIVVKLPVGQKKRKVELDEDVVSEDGESVVSEFRTAPAGPKSMGLVMRRQIGGIAPQGPRVWGGDRGRGGGYINSIRPPYQGSRVVDGRAMMGVNMRVLAPGVRVPVNRGNGMGPEGRGRGAPIPRRSV